MGRAVDERRAVTPGRGVASYPAIGMAFRDDREALRAQRDALAQERDDLRDQLEESRSALAAHEAKDERDEAELARLREQVETLEREVGGPSTPSGLPGVAKRVIALVIVGAAVSGLAYVLYVTEVAPEPVVTSAGVEPGRPSEPAAPSPPREPLSYDRWAAVVASAEGAVDVAPDDGCLIEARVERGDVSELTVTCGDEIYDAAMSAGAEMTMSEEHLDALSWPNGRVSHTLRYRDTGMRTGPRPQLVVDTVRRSARIWRDAGDPFEMRLHVASWSAPPLFVAAPPSAGSMAEPVRLGATVVEGSIAGADGPCELSVHPENGGRGYDCRVLLRCADRLVYGDGTGGLVDCHGGDELAPLRADDARNTAQDGDPRISLDLAERRLTVGDEGWEATLSLGPHPRCGLEGTWRGQLRGADGEASPLTLTTAPTPQLTIADADPFDVELDVDCETGAAVLRGSNTTYPGRFGPGFATLVGDRGAPHGLYWLRRASR